MTGTKQVRIRKCSRECEHWLNRNSATWRWPCCDAVEPFIELDDKFMEEGDCPLDLWKDLIPADLDAEAREQVILQREMRISTEVEYIGAILYRMAASDAVDSRAAVEAFVAKATVATESDIGILPASAIQIVDRICDRLEISADVQA